MKAYTKMASTTRCVLFVSILIGVTGGSARAQHIEPEPLNITGTIDTRFGAVTFEQGNPTDIWFGPESPKGKEGNWIPTVSGRACFAYLRLYAPLEPYFAREWPVPDIQLVK